MTAGAQSPEAPNHGTRDRAAAAFVLVLLAVGSLALWVAIPPAVIWATSKAISNAGGHFVATLMVLPAAMALFAAGLVRLNHLYLRIQAATRVEDREWEDDEDAGPAHGPLEPLLVVSFGLALVSFVVWFLVFAENPNTAVF